MSADSTAAVRATPWWVPAALAWSFLTVLPSPGFGDSASSTLGQREIGRALTLFPVVGALLGLGLGAIGLLLDLALPPGPVAALILAFGAFVSGGLHLDGLMDTADGVFGGHTPARRLEILKDSRVGSFGVLAGVLALLGQFSVLSLWTGGARLTALVGALTLARWAMVLALATFPPARPSGLGATFRAAATNRALAVATALTVTIVALTGGPVGLIGLVATGATTLLLGRFLTHRIGGLTGDCYGAANVVAETLVLYLYLALGPQLAVLRRA
ncbi:MAG: adenosylcobinamide-GDP ribazoletransferase [Chloroflexi bacterium]|nr:adenosylcobinamide-GDP ribazoletransferase [Chloroflexota bacterium]